ncbi:MAG: tetratricopeptide repeat protein [Myxococcaceae bacterium]
MHRSTLALLGALWALAACQKPSPVAPPPPPVEAAPRASLEAPALPPAEDAGAEPAPDSVAARVAAKGVLGLAHVDSVDVYNLARAKALREEGDTLGALAEARRQLADSPLDEDALEMVGRAARSLGQAGLAAAAFERLAGVHPDDASPLIEAARMDLLAGDEVGAARLAAQALARDEGNVEAYQVLGRAALVEGDVRHAIEWLEQARTLAPAHGWVLNNLGFAYLRAGENAKALETLQRASELLPEVALVQNNLGVALERVGQSAEASAAFEKSATLAPGYTRALVNRARLALLRTQEDGGTPAPEADADGGEE